MTSPAPDAKTTGAAADDVRQLGLVAAIASLGYVFWVVGGMEMIERLAYYGVKAVATLYAKDPVSKGGLGVTMTEFGDILMAWALVQSVLPVVTGGLSDRFGYKETIAASTVVKISGYLTMAMFPTFGGFFAGAMLLAAGTAIFKPGIQGTLVKATSRENSSMAWGIFYQTVNIGGFLGPLLAGLMRKMEWRYVFLACAAIISLNFLMLLVYKEPGKADRLAKAAADRASGECQESLVRASLRELARPEVWAYLLVFSGFWFMFNALFDVLPAHLEEWVDTRGVVGDLFGGQPVSNPIVKFFVVMSADGSEVLPEGMLNLNSGLIMLTCFGFAWISGLMRATTSMVVGTLLASASLFLIGAATAGWAALAAIAVFSIGEMLSSPKFSEFMGNLAPSDKKAMYLGFSQIPLAIGWSLEGKLGPMLYDRYASKEAFAREALAGRGLDAADLAAIPQGEAFTALVKATGRAPWDVTADLAAQHDIGMVWDLMGVVGVVSAAGIYAYGRWIRALAQRRASTAG